MCIRDSHSEAGRFNAFGTLIDGSIERITLNNIDGWQIDSHLDVNLTRQPVQVSEELCHSRMRS